MSRHLCSALLGHPTCVGAHDFSHGPPWLDLCPPLCNPIKKNPKIAPGVRDILVRMRALYVTSSELDPANQVQGLFICHILNYTEYDQ